MEFKLKVVKQQKTRNLLAWVGELFAFVAGTAAAATWLGALFEAIKPGGFVGVCIALGVFVTALLLWVTGVLDDGVPNRWTIYIELFLPALFSCAFGGSVGAWVDKWVSKFNLWIAAKTNAWIIDTPMKSSAVLVLISIICGIVAIYCARMWAPPRLRGNKDGDTVASTKSDSATTTTTAARRYTPRAKA